jgi:hypothetical protein
MDPRRAQTALCVLRSAIGVVTWLAPSRSGRTFGLGDAFDPPDAALVARLFAVRDLALAQALRHPDPAVRRQVLRAGVVVDGVDVVASLVAALRGGRRTVLVGVGLGAALFAGAGVLALRDPDPAA